MNLPLLSIVIPIYNAQRYLEDCLRSLAEQTGPDIEVIVRDGGSTDESPKILERYARVLDSVETRPDKGQSDAIDQGFRISRGRFLTWLNADDVLMPGALSSIRRAIAKRPQISWWIGDTVLLDEQGRIKSASRAGDFIYGSYLRYVATYGPSSIFSRRVYEDVGGLDLSFHYMMDTDLWYRFAQAGYRYERDHHHWWGFRQHEASKTTAHMFAKEEHDPFSAKEYRQNAERHECYLRHGINGGARREKVSLFYARLLRTAKLSLPLQFCDTWSNRGRHFNDFKRFPIR